MKYDAIFVIFEKAATFEIVVCYKFYMAQYGLRRVTNIDETQIFVDLLANVTHIMLMCYHV